MKKNMRFWMMLALAAAAVRAHAGLAEDAGRALDNMVNLLADDMRGTKNSITSAVADARQTASRVWSDAQPSVAQAKSDATGQVGSAQSAWEDYQRRWIARPANVPVNLDVDFPELSDLKAQSDRYATKLSAQLPGDIKRRQVQVAETFARLDKKYKDSVSSPPAAPLDLSRFPDIQGLLRSNACETAPLTAGLGALDQHLKGYLSLLKQLTRQNLGDFDFSTLLQQGQSLATASCVDQLKPLSDADAAGKNLADARQAVAAVQDVLRLANVEVSADASLWQGKLKPFDADRRALASALERAAVAADAWVGAGAQTVKTGAVVATDAATAVNDLALFKVRLDPTAGQAGVQFDLLAHVKSDAAKLAVDYSAFSDAASRSASALNQLVARLEEIQAAAGQLSRDAGSVDVRTPPLGAVFDAAAKLSKLQGPAAAARALTVCTDRNDPGVRAFAKAAADLATKDMSAGPAAIKHDLEEAIRAGEALSAALNNVESLTGVFVGGSCSANADSASGSCKAGSIGFAIAKLDASIKADPTGVNFEAGLKLNLAAVPAAAAALVKNGQDAATALANAGTTADLFNRQAKALISAIDVSKSISPVIVNAVKNIPDLAELSAAGRQLSAAVSCVQAKQQMADRALQNLPNLLAVLKGLKGAGKAPAWLIERVDQCLATAQDHSKVDALIAVVGQVGRQSQDYLSAYVALMRSVTPIPQSDAPQKLQSALDKLQALQQSVKAASDVAPAVGDAQSAVATCVFYVKNSLIGGDFAQDGPSLSFEPVDLGPWQQIAGQEADAVAHLAGTAERVNRTWAHRLEGFTTRAARVVRAVDADLKRRIDSGLFEAQGFLYGCTDAMNSAVSHADQLGNSLASKESSAVDEIVRNVRRDIGNVVWRLKPLIPPPVGTRSLSSGPPSEDDLRSVIAAANQVKDSADHAGDNARQAFDRKIQQVRGWLQNDIAAAQDKASRAKAKAQEVRNWIAAAPAP